MSDIESLKEVAGRIKRRFSIKRVILVFDRGIVGEDDDMSIFGETGWPIRIVSVRQVHVLRALRHRQLTVACARGLLQ